MRRTGLLVILSWLLGGATQAQTLVKLCDLLRHPEKYNGQKVKVRATFRYGFEWQQLYCLDCLDKGRAWLELPDDLDEGSEKAISKMPKGAGIVNLTVMGTFHGKGSYGHQNGYHYELIPQEIRDVAIIQRGMKDVATEKKAEQQWACGGSTPK